MPLREIINDNDFNPVLFDLLKSYMLNDSRQGVHCTNLTSCLRQWALQQVYDYTELASNLYPMLKGTLGHEGLDLMLNRMKRPDWSIESPSQREFNGITIYGKPDFRIPKVLIADWKWPTSLPSQPKDSHIPQVNTYRWMLDDWDVQTLQVVYFGAKMHRTFDLPVWSQYDTEAWLDKRLAVLTDFQESGFLPPCEGKEQKGWCVRCSLKSVCDELDSSGTICL
jgi:hypothetical protein